MNKQLLFIALISILLVCQSLAQTASTMPSRPNNAYTNKTVFDVSAKKFDFIYEGSDGTLKFEYHPQYSGSLAALKCIADSTYSFLPSSCGGFTFFSGTTEIFPWSANVSFEITDAHTIADTLYISWKTGYNNTFLNYTYRMYMAGRTLEISLQAKEPIAPSFVLDRTDQTINPTTISIPYLPIMNVLLTNNYFVSAYFDWEQTHASEIQPLYGQFSSTSVYFAQQVKYFQKTNGQRNAINEKLYFTVSPKLDQVLPHLPNPVSPEKQESANRVVFDIWEWPFNTCRNFVEQCYSKGIKDLWVIHHNWQNAGYDNKYPDVLPANPIHGGNAALQQYSDTVLAHNDLFSLHENYVDMYPNAASWNASDIALLSDGSQAKAWYNGDYQVQSYLLKPAKAKKYADLFAPQIHATFNTNASFVDVHSSVNPAGKTDFDASVDSSAMLLKTMHDYRNIASVLRNHHQGPVSGEGYFHFMYTGYFDDFEPQINTAAENFGVMQGYRLPLLLNFKLNEMHTQTAMHGVGYLERFFSNTDGSSNFTQRNKSEVLTYIATELAYGNCSFIATPGRFVNFLEAALLEYNHVFSAQQYYALVLVNSIKYNDNGQEVDVSDYIKKHPNTYSDINSVDFMSQVKVTYDNGTVVYVNRHPTKTWQIDQTSNSGWYNYHATIDSKDSLYTGVASGRMITLPPQNGWLIYAAITDSKTNNQDESFNIYPNPANLKVVIQQCSNGSVLTNKNNSITMHNSLGQVVYHSSCPNHHSKTEIDISQFTPGIYYIKMENTIKKFVKR